MNFVFFSYTSIFLSSEKSIFKYLSPREQSQFELPRCHLIKPMVKISDVYPLSFQPFCDLTFLIFFSLMHFINGCAHVLSTACLRLGFHDVGNISCVK